MTRKIDHAHAAPPPARLASLDAFRGFVILTMIFVNYCAGINGIPDWMKHAPADLDGYTYVDVVFPGFLFIVGVAIPFSLQKRIDRGDSRWGLLVRIIPRALALMFLGTVFVSKDNYNAEASGLSPALWSLLFYLCVMILWRVESAPIAASLRRPFSVSLTLRVLAWVVLALLLLVFRQTSPDGTTAWLRTSWWGILGMIGWSYLAASVAYLLTRGNQMALTGTLGFMIALYIGEMHGGLPGWLNWIFNALGVGGLFSSHAALVTAGVLVGSSLSLSGRGEASPEQAKRVERGEGSKTTSPIRFMFWLGLGLYAAGQVIRPLHKISKINGTDAYALVTAGECALLLLLFYWAMDLKGWTKAGSWLVPVGVNPLLAYILPDTFAAILDLVGTTGLKPWGWFWWTWNGWGGVLNSAVMTAFMLGLTALLTKWKLVLKL